METKGSWKPQISQERACWLRARHKYMGKRTELHRSNWTEFHLVMNGKLWFETRTWTLRALATLAFSIPHNSSVLLTTVGNVERPTPVSVYKFPSWGSCYFVSRICTAHPYIQEQTDYGIGITQHGLHGLHGTESFLRS